MERCLQDGRLKAPEGNGQILVEPSADVVSDLLSCEDSRERSDYDLQGRPLAVLAREAQAELLVQGQRYTSQYRDVDIPDNIESPPIFLAGHQPQLFHSGVWFKNFTLGALARRHDAVAVNLLIDNDTVRSASVRVASGSVDAPRYESVPLDQSTIEVPYEQRSIADPQCFQNFGRLATETTRGLVANPLVKRWWPDVIARSRENENLGQCLAQARHQLEAQWGLDSLEVPLSQVCQLEAFFWFAAHVLAQLPRFWEIYNSGLAEYRARYRVRSRSHPAADLSSRSGWLESPFWIWTNEAPQRKPLFARQRGDEIVLSDRSQLEFPLALTPEGEATKAVEQLWELAQRGVKIRTRALVTTMFARLLLGDLFVHGIGGAKYDRLTDRLTARFFGVTPAPFIAVSATLLLPIQRPRVDDRDDRKLGQQLRELAFHPEKHITPMQLDDPGGKAPGGKEAVEELIQNKRAWVHNPPRDATPLQRHLEITRVNQALQPWLADQRTDLIQKRQALDAQLKAERILSSREYAFCLFPEEPLRDLMNEARSG